MTDDNGAEVRRGPGRPPNPHRLEMAAQAEAQRQLAEEAEAAKPKRLIRSPFGSQRQKLMLEPREGYHRHWLNDEPGRIEQAIAGGWTHIKGTDGQNLKRIVNPASNGMAAYAMEILQEWYDEDMAAEKAKVDEIDKAIRRGQNIKADDADKQHFYASAQGRKIAISESR